MDCSPPASSVHGILQARILEWIAISFSMGSSRSSDRIWVSHIAGRSFTIWATREAQLDVSKLKVLVVQLCPTLCDPMDCSFPGSSVHGILQARVLEWVAIAFFYRVGKRAGQVGHWMTMRLHFLTSLSAPRQGPSSLFASALEIKQVIVIFCFLTKWSRSKNLNENIESCKWGWISSSFLNLNF